MGMFVPKKIEIDVSESTVSLVQYVVDKIDIWVRHSIFWRGQ